MNILRTNQLIAVLYWYLLCVCVIHWQYVQYLSVDKLNYPEDTYECIEFIVTLDT